jgi:hypothetical protein
LYYDKEYLKNLGVDQSRKYIEVGEVERMAHEVFVSYSSKDKPVADAVVASLEQKGIRCWFAPRDVTPGTSWGQAIVDAIEASQIMVIILSENSNNSRQVVREVERAVANNVIIIPFRIENIAPTGAMAYFLSSEHWLDALTPPLEKHIEKLGSTIQLFLSGDEDAVLKQRLSTPAAQQPAKRRRSWPLPLAAILVSITILVILGVIFIPQWTGKSPPEESALPTEPLPTTAPTPTETPSPTPAPSFSVIGEYRTSRAANGLFITNNMLYLANGGDGLIRLNVSDPANFKPVDTYQAEDAREVVVDNDIIYLISGEYSRELIIIPLDAESSPISFRPESISGASSLYYVTAAGGLAHLTGHNYWGIVDMSDPSKPKELWSWAPASNSGNPCNAVVNGNIAYIGGGWTGLHVFDFSNPRHPELIGQFDTPNWIIGMAYSDDVLYLTLGETGLMALDVSDPARPLLMDRIDLPGFASDLSVVENRLFVICNAMPDSDVLENSLIAVDISDPEALSSIAVYNELDTLSDVQAVGDVIFVAEEARGVKALRFGLNQE